MSLLLCKINIILRASQLHQNNYWKYFNKKEYNVYHLCLGLSFIWASFSSLLLCSSQNQMLSRSYRNSPVDKWSYVVAPQSVKFKKALLSLLQQLLWTARWFRFESPPLNCTFKNIMWQHALPENFYFLFYLKLARPSRGFPQISCRVNKFREL